MATTTATRRLAAILTADVVGYSRLMGADEEGTHERLKAHLAELVDPKIGEHHGRVVKNTGDGVLAEFPSIVDAVRCAAEVQRGMLDREPGVPSERRIRLCIGINLGDVIADADDIFGDGVNVAARLEALAEPGGICVSGVVHDQIRDKLPYPLEDRGEQNVKNIARAVRVYALRPEIIADLPTTGLPVTAPRRRRTAHAAITAAAQQRFSSWWFWPTTNSPPTAGVAAATPNVKPLLAPRLSIVVLPFSNLSNDPEQEYFVDGITDDLTTDLSRISGSFVIARNTAFTYKGKPVDAKQVGRELGVRYVLEGSVRRTGDQVQMNAQLIDAETGAHVWADRFDTNRANLVEGHNEITGRLAQTLNTELIGAAGHRIEQEGAVDPDAQDLVMRGRAVFNRTFSVANQQEAQRLFEQALEIDPRSIDARIGLAGSWSAI
jgi:TolB-like protein/class 3 adenylate cyclase